MTMRLLSGMFAGALGLAALGTAPAQAGDFNFGIEWETRDRGPQWTPRPQIDECETRVWVEPVYQTVCERVWVAPVYRTVCERVWVPEQCEEQEIIHRRGNRTWREKRHVVIAPGRWENRETQVLVTPGHYEDMQKQVLVRPGYWETRVDRYDRSRHASGPTWGTPRNDSRVRIEIGRRW